LVTNYDFWLTARYSYVNASGVTVTGYEIFPMDLGNPPACAAATLTSFTIPLSMYCSFRFLSLIFVTLSRIIYF
jgi:hypothetical protein